jgi:hypothetical protein
VLPSRGSGPVRYGSLVDQFTQLPDPGQRRHYFVRHRWHRGATTLTTAVRCVSRMDGKLGWDVLGEPVLIYPSVRAQIAVVRLIDVGGPVLSKKHVLSGVRRGQMRGSDINL